jgi:hypothetical protein
MPHFFRMHCSLPTLLLYAVVTWCSAPPPHYLFTSALWLTKSRYSSVGIVLGYGLDVWGCRAAGAGNFSLHHRVQNGSGAHPASYPIGTGGSFPAEVKEWVELYLHSPVHLHGVVFSKKKSTGITLSFTMIHLSVRNVAVVFAFRFVVSEVPNTKLS